MRVKKQKAIELGNNLVAFYKFGVEFDTPLDAEDIQRKRIKCWCEKYGFEVVEEIVGDLDKAFERAKCHNGRVIAASLCRIADDALGYLNYAENENTPFVLAEDNGHYPGTNPIPVKGSFLENMLKCTNAMRMGERERYLADCRKWLNS